MKWVFGLAALLVLFLAIFFLTPTVATIYVGDPLPQSLRTKFNSLAHIGKRAEATMHVMRASNQRQGKDVEVRYTTIATQFNSLIDRAIEGVKLNRVDENFLTEELDKLLSMAREFDVEVDTYRPVSHVTPKEVRDYLDTVRDFADSSMKDWRRLASKREEMQRITIRQLQDMRWLRWGAKRSDSGPQRTRLVAAVVRIIPVH